MQKLSYLVILLFFIFNSTLFSQTSPHGDNLKIDCVVCHTTDGWGIANSKFDHSSTGFELSGQHKDVSCTSCHSTLNFSEAETNCASCHTDIHENSVGADCESCHTPQSWVISNIEDIHRRSRFALLGPHKVVDCNECHISNSLLNFKPIGANCYDCHFDDYQATTAPSHVASNYSTNCEECHDQNSPSWQGAGILHTFFPLTGGHNIDDCFQCHQQDSFAGLTQDCKSCHINDFNNTVNPSHLAIGFSTDCQECHTINSWESASFKSHDTKFFPVYSGKHNGEWDECGDCHTNSSNYAQFSCLSCHEHNKTDMDSEHRGISGYVYESNACFTCHPSGSEEGSFTHTQAFPLVDSHANLSCSECHSTTYSGTSSECISCHQSNFETTQNPSHQTLALSQQCEECHTAKNWTPSIFKHSSTGFELLGSHATVNCSDCHASNVTNAVQDCYACHQSSFETTQNPNHQTLVLSQQCEQCHTAENWKPSTFKHATTGFELLGSHATVNCSDCHTSNVTNAVQDCYACHQSNFETTQNPNHQTLVLSQQCEQCHTAENWKPSTFKHATTGFELLGSHATVNCSDCHASNVTNAVPDCFSCHEEQYNIAPDHLSDGFPKECELCHNTVTWIEVTFDHDATDFPLTGAHLNSDCSSCHANGYSNISTECSSCHQTNFDNTTNPSHKTLGLSVNCEVCHTTNAGWEPAKFPDHNNYYQLVGAHATISNQCADCHNGNYNNTPSDCFGCHETDYNNTSNPSHSVAQFPTNCNECHSQSSWTPATFDHDSKYFPIYSGKHNGEWNQCNECHTTQNNYSLFSCIDCHEHNNKTEVDSDHSGISGYAYQSNACYSCHPTGNEDDGGDEIIKLQIMH